MARDWKNCCRILFFTGLSAIIGCGGSKTFDSLDQFEKYLKADSSPYLRTITENGVIVSLRYMPADALMVNSIRQFLDEKERLLKNPQLSAEQRTANINSLKTELLKRRETYQRSIYFYLTIRYEDPTRDIIYEKMKGGHEAYNTWLQKLMFGLKDNIYLQPASMDEIPLDQYHMERTFGLDKSGSFILVFPSEFNGRKVLDPENKWLQLHLEEFGLATGPLVFEFKLPLSEVKYRGD
jgi:hypothetical protein